MVLERLEAVGRRLRVRESIYLLDNTVWKCGSENQQCNLREVDRLVLMSEYRTLNLIGAAPAKRENPHSI